MNTKATRLAVPSDKLYMWFCSHSGLQSWCFDFRDLADDVTKKNMGNPNSDSNALIKQIAKKQQHLAQFFYTV